MRNQRLILTEPAEAAVLNQITVRLVRPEEQGRWEQLVSEHHCLKNANLASRALALNLARLSTDWQEAWAPELIVLADGGSVPPELRLLVTLKKRFHRPSR